jgi:hypothetical protein
MDAKNLPNTLPLSMLRLDLPGRNCFYNPTAWVYDTGMATATLPMTREEIREEVETIRKVSKKIRSSKKSAERFLMQFGVLTKSGKLKAKYR